MTPILGGIGYVVKDVCDMKKELSGILGSICSEEEDEDKEEDKEEEDNKDKDNQNKQ